jgi:hypothetical protein
MFGKISHLTGRCFFGGAGLVVASTGRGLLVGTRRRGPAGTGEEEETIALGALAVSPPRSMSAPRDDVGEPAALAASAWDGLAVASGTTGRIEATNPEPTASVRGRSDLATSRAQWS